MTLEKMWDIFMKQKWKKFLNILKKWKMKTKISIWHNTRGIANQYFICRGDKVLCQVPNILGKMFDT